MSQPLARVSLHHIRRQNFDVEPDQVSHDGAMDASELRMSYEEGARGRTGEAMKKKSNKAMSIWVVYFVGFDDDDKSSAELNIEPRVAYEKFETTANAEQQRHDAEVAAFLRGGQVLAVVDDNDEKIVQSVAAALEKQILRMR
jgi:hypothetical protein